MCGTGGAGLRKRTLRTACKLARIGFPTLVEGHRGRRAASQATPGDMGADEKLKMDDSVRAVFEKYSWDAYPSKHLKYFEIGAFDLEVSLATDETMYITDQSVSDADCVALGKALRMTTPVNLKNIYLSNNCIGDAGCTAIAQGAASAPNFELLYIARNQIGDAGVAAVAQHLAKTKIWQLVLTENKFGDAGVSALAAAVQKDASAFSSLKWL